MTRDDTARKDRHSGDPKTSVRAPAKKEGGGGRYTMGRLGETSGGATVDSDDPNYDPDERRVDPDDGTAYKYDELAAFYKGKFTKQAIAEYWEYECTPAKRKGRAKESSQAPAGPSLAESAAQAKATKSKWQPTNKQTQEVAHDGPLAKEVADSIPYYPFKKLDKYYDVQGLLHHPSLLDAVCTVMADRFRKMGVTKLVAFEARGFLFTPVAIKTGLPFIMLRKKGKMPNTLCVENLCVQKGAIVAGDKVVLLDDILATGSTSCAGVELVKACKAEVKECCCMVELTSQNGRELCIKAGAKQVWSFISEELLTKKAELPAGYADDGIA